MTSSPESRSVTTASGTWLGPAGRVLGGAVGPEAEVEDGGVARAGARVVVEAAFADLVVGGRAGACFAGAAGGAAAVVVEVPNVVAVDGLGGAGLAVDDVVGSAGGMAVGTSEPPPPPQA